MHLFYEQYRPKIMAIAKRYRALSPAFDDDDLEQIGLLGIFQALTKYDHAENIDMRFSTYLEWSIRNLFQRTIGYTDKFVEIYGRNDDFTCVVSYREFLLKKKAIISGGGRYVIRSRQCYLSDVHRLSNSCAPGAHHPGEAAEETEWRDQGDDRSEGASYEG
jgi:RNA polymerase sigma factor (sigma-70 family)